MSDGGGGTDAGMVGVGLAELCAEGAIEALKAAGTDVQGFGDKKVMRKIGAGKRWTSS